MKKDLTIIIPVYNVEKYLRECLDSAINQTLKNIEIICINDCSPDNSLKILEEYAKKDNRIKIINLKDNVGQGVARNKAIEIATGEFITFLDSDDYMQENGYEIALKKVSNKTDVILFGFESFNEDETLNTLTNNYDRYYNKNLPFFLNEVNCNDFKYFLNAKKIPVSPCKIYNSDFLKKNNIKFIDGRCIHEDEGWFIKWLSCSPNVVSVEDRIYKRRIRVDSTMGKVNFDKNYIKKSIKHKQIVAQDALNYLNDYNKKAWKTFSDHIENIEKKNRKKYIKYSLLMMLTIGLAKELRNKKNKYKLYC